MHASAYVHADPCNEGVRWQLLSEAKHSSSHKNFSGRRYLENLYGLTQLQRDVIVATRRVRRASEGAVGVAETHSLTVAGQHLG